MFSKYILFSFPYLSLNNNNKNNQTDIVSFEIHVRFSNQQQHRISILKLYILYYICGERLLGCPKMKKKDIYVCTEVLVLRGGKRARC